MATPDPRGSASALLDRLREPETVEALNDLLDRVEAANQAVDRLSELVHQVPGLVAMATDSADEAYRRAAEAGVDLDTRIHTTLALLEGLSAPRTVRVLERLAELADQAPGLVAMAVDSLDEWVGRAAAKGLDVDAALSRGAAAALRFAARMGPDQLAAVDALLDSGVLDPAAVRVVACMGGALAAAAEEEVPPVGPMGALRAARDPDVRSALGFFVRFAEHFGQGLRRLGPPPE